jgi:hypothetical protein
MDGLVFTEGEADGMDLAGVLVLVVGPWANKGRGKIGDEMDNDRRTYGSDTEVLIADC